MKTYLSREEIRANRITRMRELDFEIINNEAHLARAKQHKMRASAAILEAKRTELIQELHRHQRNKAREDD